MQLSFPLISTFYLGQQLQEIEDNYNTLACLLTINDKIKIESKLIKREHDPATFEKYQRFYKVCRSKDQLLESINSCAKKRLIVGLALLILFPIVPIIPLTLASLVITSEAFLQKAYYFCQSRKIQWHAGSHHQDGLRFVCTSHATIQKDGTAL